ncbi:hypothetical protein AVEN_203193-1 [Araneus ventricosus]|uniref:Uncharacterized protein n=1 Tax=Araneus ventricosus TaxID=182803 RepID=A0A4Y2CI98_ARAVE|nr:hypothetical protein AVEN_203193-1 [Araneus ventricosus]
MRFGMDGSRPGIPSVFSELYFNNSFLFASTVNLKFRMRIHFDPLSSPIVCRQERERVPKHLFRMRVEDFFGVVCSCADSDLFTGLRRMPLISPHFHWSTVCSLRFDWSAYEYE